MVWTLEAGRHDLSLKFWPTPRPPGVLCVGILAQDGFSHWTEHARASYLSEMVFSSFPQHHVRH